MVRVIETKINMAHLRHHHHHLVRKTGIALNRRKRISIIYHHRHLRKGTIHLVQKIKISIKIKKRNRMTKARIPKSKTK